MLEVATGLPCDEVWFIDPLLRTLEVLRWQREGWLLVGTFSEGEHVRAEPFDAVELDLGGLWPGEDEAGAAGSAS